MSAEVMYRGIQRKLGVVLRELAGQREFKVEEVEERRLVPDHVHVLAYNKNARPSKIRGGGVGEASKAANNLLAWLTPRQKGLRPDVD